MKIKINLTHILILIAILILLYMIFFGSPSDIVVVNRPIAIPVEPRIRHVRPPIFFQGGCKGPHCPHKKKFPKIPKIPKKIPKKIIPLVPKIPKKIIPLVPGGGGNGYPGDPYPGL